MNPPSFSSLHCEKHNSCRLMSCRNGYFSSELSHLVPLSILPANGPQNPPEQSRTPLITSLSPLSHRQQKAKIWLTPPAKPTLLHYLVPFIPPSTCAVGQSSAGVQGGGFWQDGNMMTHQSPGEKNPPPHQDMCHSPAFFVGFFCPRRQR